MKGMKNMRDEGQVASKTLPKGRDGLVKKLALVFVALVAIFVWAFLAPVPSLNEPISSPNSPKQDSVNHADLNNDGFKGVLVKDDEGQTTKCSDRQITATDIKLHSTCNWRDSIYDLWLVINRKVYNVTSFVPEHPGGNEICNGKGRDATETFRVFHPPHVAEVKLPEFCIGRISITELHILAEVRDSK
jgi:cytochrome b involved in lipid metabolism